MKVDNLKMIDVTLRDGGYVNNHAFLANQSYQIVNCLFNSNISLIEIGYFKRLPEYLKQTGPGVCDVSYLAALKKIGANNYVIMVRPGDVKLEDYVYLKDYGIQMVRFAAPLQNDLQMLEEHILAVRSLGLKVSVNCTRSSSRKNKDIAELMEFAIKNGANYFYIADTNGAYYPSDISKLFHDLNNNEIILGYHAHNNIEMAFANTITAIEHGAKIIDSSVAGLGKNAGNLDSILISIYLNQRYNFNIKIDPLLEIVEYHIAGLLRPKILKEYLFKFTGLLNANTDYPEVIALYKEINIKQSYQEFLCKLLSLGKIYSVIYDE